jgi:3-phosphoglycerate kinase
MVLVLAELIFVDSPTRNNRELTEFLKRNIEKVIIKGCVKFKFKIAKASDIPNLRKRNISRLPAMVLQGRNFIGVPDITNELSKRVKNSKATAQEKTGEEFIDDFFKKTINTFLNQLRKVILSIHPIISKFHIQNLPQHL